MLFKTLPYSYLYFYVEALSLVNSIDFVIIFNVTIFLDYHYHAFILHFAKFKTYWTKSVEIYRRVDQLCQRYFVWHL